MPKLRGLVLFCLLLLISCSSTPGGTYAWIDVPVNPTSLSDIQPITIKGHASSPAGIALVEIWVNGTLMETINSPPATGILSAFESTFTPPEPGEYMIQVIAISTEDEASEPDTAIVLIDETVAAIPLLPDGDTTPVTPTPVPTFTPTPTPTAVESDDSQVVSYWADPAEIEAGGCTTIYWEVSNVSKVEFGGFEQDFSGSYYDCMCETQTYPMTVTYENSTQETFWVTIDVTGTCATPTPTPSPTPTPTLLPDTTAPDPPALLSPTNGVSLSCTSFVTLQWNAASDLSGISEYRIKVERHSGDNNWQAAPGSVFSGIGGTQKQIPVECGWDYRWRVRARDGAGNLGGWSGWFTFADLLS
jgi:hypothetical protein